MRAGQRALKNKGKSIAEAKPVSGRHQMPGSAANTAKIQAFRAAGTANAADPCCDDDAPACPTATTAACDGCTDYLLTVQIALPASDAPVALPASPLVVIDLLNWPEVSAARLVYDRWVNDRASPLAFLRTVVLRC